MSIFNIDKLDAEFKRVNEQLQLRREHRCYMVINHPHKSVQHSTRSTKAEQERLRNFSRLLQNIDYEKRSPLVHVMAIKDADNPEQFSWALKGTRPDETGFVIKGNAQTRGDLSDIIRHVLDHYSALPPEMSRKLTWFQATTPLPNVHCSETAIRNFGHAA